MVSLELPDNFVIEKDSYWWEFDDDHFQLLILLKIKFAVLDKAKMVGNTDVIAVLRNL